ncbi:hypothetical protein ACFL2V_05300 [Pseudomonadota bacterium]
MKLMGLRSLIIGVAFLGLSPLNASASLVELHISSNIAGGYEHKSKIIDIADPYEQISVAKEAGLFALSTEGWDWANLGDSSYLWHYTTPGWTAEHIVTGMNFPGQVSQEIADKFGYDFNQEALDWNATHYQMHFHTDAWVARGGHDIGERPNNYGVITGGTGGIWHQTETVDWGSFWIEEVTTVPTPASVWLLLSGLVALLSIRKARATK